MRIKDVQILFADLQPSLLTGSRTTSPDTLGTAATALAKAGAVHLYLAGRGGESESALKAAGVATFIYSSCDMLKTLRAAHDMISQS